LKLIKVGSLKGEWKRKQRMTEELKVELALKMLLVLRIRSLIYLYQMKLKTD